MLKYAVFTIYILNKIVKYPKIIRYHTKLNVAMFFEFVFKILFF